MCEYKSIITDPRVGVIWRSRETLGEIDEAVGVIGHKVRYRLDAARWRNFGS